MKLWEISARVLLALVLSGAIGLEREHRHKAAGLKTHILVGVSAATVMILSEFIAIKHSNFDGLTRMGAQVVSGIGFLGAGTIIVRGGHVSGLTTAASIWSVACLGLVCGAGFYAGALIGSATIYITLVAINRLLPAARSKIAVAEVAINREHLADAISAMQKLSLTAETIEFKDSGEGVMTVRIRFKLRESANKNSALYAISAIDGVENARYIK